MVFCPEDTEALFSDFGVPVDIDGAPETTGVLLSSLQAERELGVTLAREESVLLLRAGEAAALDLDAVLLVDGVRYRFRGPAPAGHRRCDHCIVARSVTP